MEHGEIAGISRLVQTTGPMCHPPEHSRVSATVALISSAGIKPAPSSAPASSFSVLPACAKYFMNLEYQGLPSGQLCIHGKGANLYLHIKHPFRCISRPWKWAFSSWGSGGMSSAQSKSVISICLSETLSLTALAEAAAAH